MGWRRVCSEWTWVALALGTCLGAFFVQTRAWRVGYEANCIGLLGCQALRCLLLLVGCVTAVAALRATSGKLAPAVGTGLTVLDLAVIVLLLPGCMGLNPFWIVVLPVLTLVLLLRVVALRLSGNDADRPPGLAVMRAGLVVVLFTVTWYFCASTTRQALHGLGERLEAEGGADRFLAWAAEVIAAHKGVRQGGQLAPEEIPDFVDDLMGPFQGVRSVRVDEYGDPSVTLYTGGSAYHFTIRLRPARVRRGPWPWWLGEVAGELEWRPGIDLATEGK
jgi:hypothetical protein